MLPTHHEKSMRTVLTFAVAVLVLPVFASAAPSSTSGQATLPELQAQLQTLMTQISALQSQSTTPTAPSAGGAASASCPNLLRNLSRGMKGSDVATLQQFLISQKLLAADSATGFYGAMTEAAVKGAVHRMRQRHGELLREEIAQTVTRPEEINEELRYFRALLGRGSG